MLWVFAACSTLYVTLMLVNSVVCIDSSILSVEMFLEFFSQNNRLLFFKFTLHSIHGALAWRLFCSTLPLFVLPSVLNSRDCFVVCCFYLSYHLFWVLSLIDGPAVILINFILLQYFILIDIQLKWENSTKMINFLGCFVV